MRQWYTNSKIDSFSSKHSTSLTCNQNRIIQKPPITIRTNEHNNLQVIDSSEIDSNKLKENKVKKRITEEIWVPVRLNFSRCFDPYDGCVTGLLKIIAITRIERFWFGYLYSLIF